MFRHGCPSVRFLLNHRERVFRVISMSRRVITVLVLAVIILSAICYPLIVRYIWPKESTSGHAEQGSTSYIVTEAREFTLSELVDAVNNFTLNVYGVLLRGKVHNNIVVSPFNIYVALTLLYEGANSTTREELSRAMGLDNSDACSAYQQLLSMLPISSNSSAILYVANGAWLREGFPFRGDYVSRVKDCFSGDVYSFTSTDQLVESVNKWVEEKTRGLIREILQPGSVPAETVAVLVSAIYFKANWVIEFTPTPLMFWNGATWVEVAGMSVIGSHIKVVETEDYVAVEIPYNETSISMVIVMPSNFTRAIEKYREIIQGALRRLDEAPSGRSAYLVMPKFNITSYFDLKAVLMELGIREVFEEGRADLTRMANVARGAIFVSDVIHQAVIRVNEKGTEAAAATAIIIIESALHYEVEVIINKPFFYILRDRESKVILFIGHVVDPNASS